MSGGALVRRDGGAARAGGFRLPLPFGIGSLVDELEERYSAIPTRLNEYGVDPFGAEPGFARHVLLPMALVYRHWLRVETRNIERVPTGRVLLIGNHAGNTFAYDGAMLGMAMLLEAEPPRMVRGMAEYYLPQIPYFTILMHRAGSVVGTPENCTQLLEQGECVAVFPEGQRGFVKTWDKRYQLQRFGTGFMRLALETDTPIVPVGIVGSEEQSPAVANLRWLGRLFGSPAFPITPTFPWLGLAGFVPFPVKFRIHFGKPLRFEGDANEEDAQIEKKVERVKDAIRELIGEGLASRSTWFS